MREGKAKALLSLTYDGTQICHSETVLRHLEKTGLTGTFYADPVPLLDNLPKWRRAVQEGHEIGNGCMTTCGLMDAWSADMIVADIQETDELLLELFPGQTAFSFGYPWTEGNGAELRDVRPMIEQCHRVCRSGVQGSNDLTSLDLAFLKCAHVYDVGATAMIEITRASLRRKDWLVLAFDGVGVGDRAIDSSDHLEFCQWLTTMRELLEVVTVSEGAQVVASHSPGTLKLV